VPQPVTIMPGAEEEGVAIDPNGASLVTAIGRRRNTLRIHTPTEDELLSPEGDARNARVSSDGERLYFLWRRSPDQPVELTRMTMASRKSERLVPDYEVLDYDVSTDESLVVFTTPGADHKPEIWIASIDRRTAPRLLVRGGDHPAFGAGQDVVFRAFDGRLSYIDRIGQDGSGRQRITSDPILDIGEVSSDGRWVVADGTTSSGGDSEVQAFPASGGTSIRLCSRCAVHWSKDGRWLYFVAGIEVAARQTYAIPLQRGESLPPAADSAAPAVPQWQKRADLRTIDHSFVTAGPDPGTYVYGVLTALRNLFRVPIS
jgi:hypothetical protein